MWIWEIVLREHCVQHTVSAVSATSTGSMSVPTLECQPPEDWNHVVGIVGSPGLTWGPVQGSCAISSPELNEADHRDSLMPPAFTATLCLTVRVGRSLTCSPTTPHFPNDKTGPESWQCGPLLSL